MSGVVSPSNPRKVLHSVNRSLSKKSRQVVLFEHKRPGEVFRTAKSERKEAASLQSTALPEETTFYINPAYKKKNSLELVEPGAILHLQKTLDHIGRQVLRRRVSSQPSEQLPIERAQWRPSADGSSVFATNDFDPRRKRAGRSTVVRKRALTAAASRDFSLDHPSTKTDICGLVTERTASKSRGSAGDRDNLILITSVDGRLSKLHSLQRDPQDTGRESTKFRRPAAGYAQQSAENKLLTSRSSQRPALRCKQQANKTLKGFGVSQLSAHQQSLQRKVKTASHQPKDYDTILIEKFNSLNKQCRFEHDKSRNLLQVYNSLMKKRPESTVLTAFEPNF